ncbi:alpha/beta hydrolase [Mucilaginibacter gilvus]|uniref:Esterase family protein n=1 Tax=Mucilaginibacter gilvus TaxID=2305909 RepID=A0A444MSF7_9SPHI|nr:alpha/beta hydrolase-fold protein [Mucilaginibacter gilvus]RWY55522.1 esterase family protein [Mucilaginibacter gilvus]
MKKLLSVLLLLCPALLLAQTSKVFDNLTLNSKILKSERKFAIYLPPDYETSGRSYPVLYLLHGGGDDHTGWVQFGEVQNITDKAIRDGIATSMIIVMPDANTGRRGYYNDIKGDFNYEDFFFTELMPYVEKKYRIKADKHYRAVAGLSMGGGGSFVYALHHPEMFSSACPLSAATGFLSLEEAKAALVKNNPNVTLADSTISNYYNKYSVIPLINAMPDANKKAVRWFMDIGDDDFLYEGNGLVHNLMRKKEIPHEYRVRDGAHNWTYWRASLPVVLEFVSQAFHQY